MLDESKSKLPRSIPIQSRITPADEQNVFGVRRRGLLAIDINVADGEQGLSQAGGVGLPELDVQVVLKTVADRSDGFARSDVGVPTLETWQAADPVGAVQSVIEPVCAGERGGDAERIRRFAGAGQRLGGQRAVVADIQRQPQA